MNTIYITLAVEDFLSEAVATRILDQSDNNYLVVKSLCKGGFGYLKSKINSFNQSAKAIPFFVLTDQDSGCPPEKIEEWLQHPANPNLIFRVAVMEVESWVMAHREAFATFLSVPVSRIPKNTDELKNPKEFLLSLAGKSRSKKLREDIVPSQGATSKIGPDYNARLSNFIRSQWDVHEAIKCSESLNRAFLRIQNYKQVFS